MGDENGSGETKMSDSVNHPGHYNTGDIEVINAIEDWKLNFHLGNAVKYIVRSGKKIGVHYDAEDLKKAIWYLERHIEIYLEKPK